MPRTPQGTIDSVAVPGRTDPGGAAEIGKNANEIRDAAHRR